MVDENRNTAIRRQQLQPIRESDFDATNSPSDNQIPSYDLATGKFTWIDPSSGSTETFKQIFDNTDLTSDKITITHSLSTEHPVVIVFDNSDNVMLPSEITYLTSDTIELDFTGLTPLTGNYKVRVVGTGTDSAGDSISDADNNTKIQVEESPDENIIRFDTAGTERMTLNATGFLGMTLGTGINEFSIDGTLAGNSDDAVPTEKAVKTYADTKGDVSAGASITDNRIVRGDGGSKGIQESTASISDDGEMTNTSQPAFQVRSNAAQNNIAINTDVTVVFGSEIFDIGNNFASNVFTAPVTGKYLLSAYINPTNLDSAASDYLLAIQTSNRNYNYHHDPRQFASDIAGFWGLTNTVIADMDAGDTAKVVIFQTGGTAQTDLGSSPSIFFGYLVA